MSERVWHKGPPPHIGWWETSVSRSSNFWRWWDGESWSCFVFEDDLPEVLLMRSAENFNSIATPEWTDYWPADARVPRLDPTGGHWTFNVDGVEPKRLPRKIDIAMRSSDLLRSVDSRWWYWGLDGHPFDILAWRPAA